MPFPLKMGRLVYYLKRVPPCGRLKGWGLKSDLTEV